MRSSPVPAAPPGPAAALVAAWPRGGGTGLAPDAAALVLVAGGVLALLTAWRSARRPSGGPGR